MEKPKCSICLQEKDEVLTEYRTDAGWKKRCWECYRKALSKKCKENGMILIEGFRVKIQKQ